ncbi:MAG: stage II sporulation protein M [Oscillospiraceae bacterium]
MRVEFRPSQLDTDFLRREFLPALYDCLAAFLILCAIFAAAALLFPDFGRDYLRLVTESMAQSGLLEAESKWEMFSLLFANNLRATINTVIYGFLPFLYYPALVLGSNALTLSAMGVYGMQDGQLTPALFFAGILPHGVFEIPALAAACAVGLCHCRLVTRAILKKAQPAPWRVQTVSLSWAYLGLVVPLLLLAALAEAFLTPLVMGLFL